MTASHHFELQMSRIYKYLPLLVVLFSPILKGEQGALIFLYRNYKYISDSSQEKTAQTVLHMYILKLLIGRQMHT